MCLDHERKLNTWRAVQTPGPCWALGERTVNGRVICGHFITKYLLN